MIEGSSSKEELTSLGRRATRAYVVLAGSADGIALNVEDNGVGFDADAAPEQIRCSLANMRVRAALVGATVLVESMPGNGTSVVVRYPQKKVP
jgi:signal transduction histidine kinase